MAKGVTEKKCMNRCGILQTNDPTHLQRHLMVGGQISDSNILNARRTLSQG